MTAAYIKSPNDKHQLVIDENVADIVRRIYKMFLLGNSGRYIAEIFNREGIPTPNVYYYECINKPVPYKNQSHKWGSGTIMNILKNPAYKGDMASGKRKVASFKNKKVLLNPSDTWIIVENTHEAIIEKNVWEEAQKLIEKNHVGIRRSSTGDVSLFSGIVKCADCGTKMTYNRKIYKSSVKEYYRCGRYTNKGTNACTAHTIRQEYIYQAVIDDLRNYAKLACNDESELINRLMNDHIQHNNKAISKLEKLLKEKEYRIKEIDRLIQSLFEEKLSGTVPENIFKRMAKNYDDEQISLSEEIDRLKSELLEMKQTDKDISGWVQKIKKCLSIEKLTREIVVELVDSIEISECYVMDGEEQQDIKITYRFENISSNEKRVS